MRDLKRHTSEQLRKSMKANKMESRREWMLQLMKETGTKNSSDRGFQFWGQDNPPIELRDSRKLYKALNYIHYNPVEAGFVDKEEDWLQSSAGNYHERIDRSKASRP